MTDRHAITLEQLDRDGALLETVAALHGDTRAEFLRTAAVGGGAMLAALAAPALSCSEDVLAVLDARRGQVFARRYSEAGPTSGIYCVRPEEMSVQGSPLFVGDGAIRYREALSDLGHIPPDDSPLHRVTASGHIISAGLDVVGPEDLIPIYVREPDAEVRRDLNPWSRP